MNMNTIMKIEYNYETMQFPYLFQTGKCNGTEAAVVINKIHTGTAGKFHTGTAGKYHTGTAGKY